MNANELADKLEQGHWEGGTREQAATMLRQQQEKLTKYELRHVAQRDRIAILEMQHKQQQAEIEALKAKTLTDEEIEQVRVAIMGTAYWCADENMPEAYNAVKVCCSEMLAILRKAQEKC